MGLTFKNIYLEKRLRPFETGYMVGLGLSPLESLKLGKGAVLVFTRLCSRHHLPFQSATIYHFPTI